jgi:hypothetical protein
MPGRWRLRPRSRHEGGAQRQRSGSAAAAQRQRSGSAAAAQRHMQRVRTLREGKVTRPPLRTTTTRYVPYGNNSCVALVYIDCACLRTVRRPRGCF